MRDPMPPVYFFLIDVSVDALQTGATAAACTAVMQVISDLPVSSWCLFLFRLLQLGACRVSSTKLN